MRRQGQQRIRHAVRPLMWLTVCGIVMAGAGVIDLGTGAVRPASGADATVGFQINSVDISPLFEYENQGTDSLGDDTLTAGPAQVALSLSLDGSDLVYADAKFTFNASLTTIQQGVLPGTEVYELLFDGSFSFAESGFGTTILDATFTDARLLMLEFADAGIVSYSTGLAADANVQYVLGPAVPGNWMVQGGEEFQFTVNSLLSSGGGPIYISSVPAPDEIQFENFNFSSSLSGSMTIVPEPATFGLALVALLGMLAYRRVA